MFYLTLVDIGVTFSAATDTDCCFFWSKCTLALIYDSVRYFVNSFAVSPFHVAKDSSFIAWSRVHFLGSRLSDDKIWQSIDGMLGDMPWGAAVPLV